MRIPATAHDHKLGVPMTRWLRLPPGLRVVICGAAAFGVVFVAFLAWDFDQLFTGHTGDRLTGLAALAALPGLLAGSWRYGVELRLRRDYGSIERYAAYMRALRTGEPPVHIDPAAWREWIRRSRGANWLALSVACLAGLFVAASLTHQPAYHPISAALVGLLALSWLAMGWRKSARINRLAAEIERRESTEQSAVTPPTEKAAATRAESRFARSWATRLVEAALVDSIFAFLVLLVADLDSLVFGGPRIVPLEWAAGLAVLVGAALAALASDRRRRCDFASSAQFAEYNRAVERGELPASVEPDVWRSRLRISRRQALGPLVLACFLLAVGVFSILTRPSAYHWVSSSLFELLALWYLVLWWAARVRLTQLASDVERHAIRQTWG